MPLHAIGLAGSKGSRVNTDFSFAVSRRGFLVAAAGAAVSASLGPARASAGDERDGPAPCGSQGWPSMATTTGRWQGDSGSRHAVIDDFYDGLAYTLTNLAYDKAPSLRAHPLDAPLALPSNPLPAPDLANAVRQKIIVAN